MAFKEAHLLSEILPFSYDFTRGLRHKFSYYLLILRNILKKKCDLLATHIFKLILTTFL